MKNQTLNLNDKNTFKLIILKKLSKRMPNGNFDSWWFLKLNGVKLLQIG